jgi:hypothetical protein
MADMISHRTFSAVTAAAVLGSATSVGAADDKSKGELP